MTSAIFFFSLWIVALFASYKFVLLNIKQVEKYPERYFDNLKDTDQSH
ncbi:hypothetical protein CCAL13119_07550 [Campylobacter sp. RM13119]|nr:MULTISPECIES: hypothetical protein [unclassified Campylobacter]MBE3606794.1 hypothetical protein [Campylobacter sp. RM13119]MBE3610389.1 hypothetical protein [Campylobacter sp. RM12916]